MLGPQKHIVYRTTHIPSGHYYIGVHSTENLNDGYLGSGRLLVEALERDGPRAFKREVLREFPTRQKASDWERIVVNQGVVDDPKSFNLVRGGGNPRIRPSVTGVYAGRKRRPGIGSPKTRHSTAAAEPSTLKTLGILIIIGAIIAHPWLLLVGAPVLIHWLQPGKREREREEQMQKSREYWDEYYRSRRKEEAVAEDSERPQSGLHTELDRAQTKPINFEPSRKIEVQRNGRVFLAVLGQRSR